MTANIFYPAIPAISLNLRVSAEQIQLSVTWYMLFQGIAPSLWGAICDVLGRRPVYLVTFSMLEDLYCLHMLHWPLTTSIVFAVTSERVSAWREPTFIGYSSFFDVFKQQGLLPQSLSELGALET